MASFPELRLEDARESWFARTGEPAPERIRHTPTPSSAPRPRAVGGLAVVGVLLSLALLATAGVVVSGMLASTLLARSTQRAEDPVGAELATAVEAQVAPEEAPVVIEPEPPAPPAAPPAPEEPAPAAEEGERKQRRGLFRRKNR